VAGTQWDPSKYTSKKNAQRSNDSAEAWDIDRKEVEWAAANYESILAGVSLEPYPGGGLKINTLPEVGFAAERGLRAGDVIRAVNGQPIESIAKLQEVMSKLSRNATTLTVTLDRSGRAYSLTYTVPRPTR
jgi:S1-C subfamily serine protease